MSKSPEVKPTPVEAKPGLDEAILETKSALSAVVHRADGRTEDLGVICRRVITTAGVTFLAGAFAGTQTISNMKFHASGTGTGAEANGDTALGTETGSRVTGSQASSTNTYTTAATISYTSTLAITEHGLLSASSSGTLWDRSVFSAINVVNGDSITFTYVATFTAGG